MAENKHGQMELFPQGGSVVEAPSHEMGSPEGAEAPSADPYPYLEPTLPTKTDLLIYDLTERVNQLEDQVKTFRTGSIAQSKHIETMHAQLIALTKDFNARFGTVSNCPHCHRKLDSYTLRTKTHCPICGGSLQ